MNIIDNDLLSVQEARILLENAKAAQKKLMEFPQEKLDDIIEYIADEIEPHIPELARMSFEETEYGVVEDKIVKNRFVCTTLREKIRPMKCVGIINRNPEERTMEVGVPLGVIVGLCPATSPVSTTIYKALIAIKSGNAITFSPHPRARKVMGAVLDLIIRAGEAKGLPEGAVSYLHNVTNSGTAAMLSHEFCAMILNTGVPGLVPAAAAAGKRVIYGGSGNGPAFIEKTANIEKAVADIIISKTFDNGMVSASEQSIVVERCIAEPVRSAFRAQGGYFMTKAEESLLSKILFDKEGLTHPDQVGKDAVTLAARAGFPVPSDTKILISQQEYVSEMNPYSHEKLCPVVAFYLEDDWMHACEKCIELLITEKNGHTLVIHSNDEEVIKQFALKKPVGRVLVNTPSAQGSMGMTTNLFPAMTLGSGSAGMGITSDNVSPCNLIYIRKVGYDARSPKTASENNTTQRIQSAPMTSAAPSGCGYCRETGDDEAYSMDDILRLTKMFKNYGVQ